MVESERTENGDTATQTRYYISSLPNDAHPCQDPLGYRELCSQGVVAFGEDNGRMRTGNSTENFSVLRGMALNMLKGETSLKVGVAAKRKRAG